METATSDDRPASRRLAVGILAGERAGHDAIARAEGVPGKVLVDIAGRPMLERVIRMIGGLADPGCLYLCGPDPAIVEATPWLDALIREGGVCWQPPQPSPARSAAVLVDAAFAAPTSRAHAPVGADSSANETAGNETWRDDRGQARSHDASIGGCAAAASDVPAALLLTTGDHPLLTAATAARFVEDALATEADVVVGLARHGAVQAAFPEGKRTALKLADGPFCGCNLFLLRGPKGRALLEFWQRLEADRKRPGRMAATLGFGVVLRYLTGRLTSMVALNRIGTLTGLRVAAVAVADPDAAVDVDSLADLALVRARFEARGG